MTIIDDFKKIGSSPEKILLKYSKYSYILIGALILVNYLPKVLGLSSTILMGSLGKLLGKSSKVAPSVTSKIAAEVENLAKQLDKNTPQKIVKNVESAAKVVKQLTENSSPELIKNVVELLDNIEINLEESEDLPIPQPKQGRPSEAWKRVQNMVNDKKFREMIEEDEKMEELPKIRGKNWDAIEKMVKQDKSKRSAEEILGQKKGFFEELLDDTAWADEDIKQNGGASSYMVQRQVGFLFVVLSCVHYLDYTSSCKTYETSDLFSSGLLTIIPCLLIFILLTKIGLYGNLHMMLKRRNLGVISDLIDGGLVFFIYNIIKNMRDVTGYNKCDVSSPSLVSSSDLDDIQKYISSLEEDIKALQDKIEEETTVREKYQSELESKISERTEIVDEMNSNLQSQITDLGSSFATITEEQDNKIEEHDKRIEVLETKISDLVVSQAELQTLLESRINEIEITQLSLKVLIETNISNIVSNTELIKAMDMSGISTNATSIESLTALLSELQSKVNAYEIPVSYEERVSALEVEQSNILSNIASNSKAIESIDISGISANASAIVQNTALISSNDSSINSNTELIKALDMSGISTNTTAITNNSVLIISLDSELKALKLRVTAIEELDVKLVELTNRVTSLETSNASILSEIASDDEKQLDLEARLASLEQLDHHSHEDDVEEIENEDDNVKICHKGSTMTISAGSVEAHQNHGDTLGECVINE